MIYVSTTIIIGQCKNIMINEIHTYAFCKIS